MEKLNLEKNKIRDVLIEILKVNEFNLCFECFKYIDPVKKLVFICPVCNECYCIDCKKKMKITLEDCGKICDKSYPCDICLKISEKCIKCQENKKFLIDHTLT